jgi:hypothetical protein
MTYDNAMIGLTLIIGLIQSLVMIFYVDAGYMLMGSLLPAGIIMIYIENCVDGDRRIKQLWEKAKGN